VHVQRTRKAAFAAAICSLALPAAASAATKTVVVGPAGKPPAGTPKDADANAFFPRALKLHAGDSLKFQFAGFHVVNFPKKGDAFATFEMPAGTTSGVKDAAGNDFWFNGQPSFALNPTAVVGTKSGAPYTGAKGVQSGLSLSDAPKPWSVKFPKTGTFTWNCPIHPGMTGKVTVVAKGKKGVPSPKADAARGQAEFKKAVAIAKALDKKAPPAGDTVVAGPDDAKSGVVLFRFSPAQKTVKVGAPVTLSMTPGTTETHTFTFAKDLASLEPVAQAFVNPQTGTMSSQVLYPSDPQLTGYDGTQHGDGFFSTGALDGDAKTPLPQKATITFAAPGTYQYLCLIHPDMRGQITVTN
jgi:plastocyanin